MPERHFEKVFVTTAGDDLTERLSEARHRGFRLEAISMAGTAGTPCPAALTWIREPNGGGQRIGDFVRGDQVSEQSFEFWNAGYAPALVAAIRDDAHQPLFRIVYEVFPKFTDVPPHLLYTSRSFDAFQNEIQPHWPKYHLRSAYVLESEGKSNEAPWFLGVLWPFRGQGMDWGLTFWDASELVASTIQGSPRARAMAVGARPWIVTPALHRVTATGPQRSGVAIRKRFLAVWRDRFFSPWPKPRPFDQNAGREAELDIEWVSGAQVHDFVDEQRGKGKMLLSWGVRGTDQGGVEFALNFIPAGAEIQPRTFILSGPGDLSEPGDTRDVEFVGDVPPPDDRTVYPWQGAEHVGPNRPLPRPRGGSGSFKRPGLAPYEGKDPDQRQARPSHPFDLVMWRWMRQNGARAAQLAVNRQGELRFSRAYTWAEDGYPITKTFHRMRTGSVSKNVTALPLVRHYLGLVDADPSDLGLDRGFNDELQINRDEPAFREVTIRHALAMTSGITLNMGYDKIVALLRPEDVPASDDLGLIGDYIPIPGEMRIAFEDWPEPLMVDTPGDTEEYNNWPYVALAELWGGLSISEDGWSQYDKALRDSLLSEANIALERAGTGATYEECVAQKEVAYHPHQISVIRPDRAKPDFWQLNPYPLHPPFSGNCCLTMRQQARVLALLTRRGTTQAYLTREQKWIMAGRPSAAVVDAPLGWDKSTPRQFFGGSDGMIRLTKNGAHTGTLAWVTHWFPGPSSALPEETTFDFAIAVNADHNASGPMTELFAAAVDVEAQGLWAPIDLSGGTDYDEEP